MSLAHELQQNNNKYAQTFDKGSLAIPPARKLAVIACMDARLEPLSQLGLNLGDAHIIRNAGGRAQDALRSIAISQQLLGTEEIVIVHHTDCGMLTFSDDVLRSKFKEQGIDASHVSFYPFPDLEQSVKDDAKILQNSELVSKKSKISGYVYDVQKGRISQIV